MSRGLLSNEGGSGTSPIAHAASKEKIPARQGLFGILEVAADTPLICSATALALLTAGVECGGMTGVLAALSCVFGAWAPPLLSVSVFAFSYATVLSASYYARSCLSFLGVRGRGDALFCFLFSLSLLFGAVWQGGGIWQASDLLLHAMTAVNLLFLFSCRRRVRALTKEAGLLPP